MKVPNYLAQGIVNDMKDIINQDINYFDSHGVIIASTDRTRVGDFHGGAKSVVDSRNDLIIKYDGQFKGARQGINLPVYFQNEIIGVIGITGEKDEVEKYGKIIQKMTEILIKDGYIKEQEKIESDINRQFVEELIFRYHSDDNDLITRAQLLNINTNVNRFVVIGRMVELDKDEPFLTPTNIDKIYNSFSKKINYNPQNLIVQNGMNIIIIYELRINENIETLIYQLKDYIENKYSIKVFFGIGNIYDDLLETKKSYGEAKKALDLSLAQNYKEILFYNDLDIGLLTHDLPLDTINKYIKKIFKDMTREQINEYSVIMDAYLKHNGSINKASEELFLHKNTLQYRLNKLKELTGYNPRNLEDMVVLYIGFTLFRLEIEE